MRAADGVVAAVSCGDDKVAVEADEVVGDDAEVAAADEVVGDDAELAARGRFSGIDDDCEAKTVEVITPLRRREP